jgi:hypothetical protein
MLGVALLFLIISLIIGELAGQEAKLTHAVQLDVRTPASSPRLSSSSSSSPAIC